MPNYISHTIMAEKTEIVSPININKNLLRPFSIGQDLMGTCRNGVNITHNQNTKQFFINLISIIKENNFCEDVYIMHYLYGHILHYALDKIAHPYIYYITNDVPKIGFLDFHTVCEEYIGYYLLNREMHMQRSELKSSFYTDFKCSKELKNFIDIVYEKTYGFKNAAFIQQQTIQIGKIIDRTKLFQNKDKYLSIISLDKYLNLTKLTEETLVNEDHDIWYNPINLKPSHLSFLNLFENAINFAQEIIKEVNKVVYENESIMILETIFDNSSYDTGLNCSIGKPWIRSRIKDQRLIK